MKRTKPKVINAIPTEHAEQSAFMTWCLKTPELENAFAIPNAGKRGYALANYMRAEGMRRGVPDVFIPVARGGFYGLFIEFKRRGRRPDEAQQEWAQRLNKAGYLVELAYSCDEGIKITQAYMIDKSV
jgi:hypothetical protein